MSQVVTCPPAGCPSIHSTACVFYTGANLLTTGINTNDSVEVILQKLDQLFLNINSNTQNIGVVNFTATADQTDFTIPGSPTTLILVGSGRNIALETTDFTYSGGILSFTTGRLVGTKIKVIYQ
jgi:hypothetical protein